eukprot:ANDGO_05360.mRNA.1 Proline--tRNA ligase
MKRLSKFLVNNTSMRFATSEMLLDALHVQPGCVNPFSLANDPECKVPLLLDSKLLEHETVNFHPMENTATCCFKVTDFLSFCDQVHHTPVVIDFASINAA